MDGIRFGALIVGANVGLFILCVMHYGWPY